MQFDLNNFTTLKPKPACRRSRVTAPVVSITNSGFSFNSYIVNKLDVVKQFVQIKLDTAEGKMAFVFFDERTLGSYKVSIPRKGQLYNGVASTTAHSVISYINEETDLLNTDVYKYRFKADVSESQSALMIDLLDPYQKSKKSKRGVK